MARRTVEMIANETAEMIKRGEFGKSGDLFVSIRSFAAEQNISYVTAQRTAQVLRNRGLLMLLGNHLYLTCGVARRSSALSKALMQRRGESRIIGMYINKMTNVFFTTIASHLAAELKAQGFELIITAGNADPANEIAALNNFILMGAEAVISCAGFGAEVSEAYRNFVLPTVFIGRVPEGCESFSGVQVNNVNAGKQVATHLHECGCSSFAYIGTAQISERNDKRLEGFKKGLENAGVELLENQILAIDPDIPPSATYAIKTLLKNAQKPLGIFCFHDMIAVNVMGICSKMSIKVGQDVKIVGFDDLPVSQFVSPPLTSISYRFDKLAKSAAEEVIKLISSPSEGGERIYINQALVIRQSSRE